MKKFYKITGIMVGTFFAIGLLLCIIGMVSGASEVISFSLKNGFQPAEEAWIYENYNMTQFDSIYIDTKLSEVEIVPTYDETYGVSCSFVGMEGTVTNNSNESELQIVQKDGDGIISFAFARIFGEEKNKITVYVPVSKKLDNIHIVGDVGTIKIDKIYGANKLDITTDVGSVAIQGGDYKEVNIVGDVGNINTVNMNATSFCYIESDVGNISVAGKLECDISMKTDTGNIEFDSKVNGSLYKYSASSEMGKISVFGQSSNGGKIKGNPSGRYSLNIETEVGNITIK